MTEQPWFITIELADIRQTAASFEEKRDWTVARLRDGRWLKLTPYPDTLHGLLNELKAATTPEEFDAAAEDVFDLADSDGVWIEREGKVVEL